MRLRSVRARKMACFQLPSDNRVPPPDGDPGTSPVEGIRPWSNSCTTGVFGGGKSTLFIDTLYKALPRRRMTCHHSICSRLLERLPITPHYMAPQPTETMRCQTTDFRRPGRGDRRHVG
jgi:hypothetical protein